MDEIDEIDEIEEIDKQERQRDRETGKSRVREVERLRDSWVDG